MKETCEGQAYIWFDWWNRLPWGQAHWGRQSMFGKSLPWASRTFLSEGIPWLHHGIPFCSSSHGKIHVLRPQTYHVSKSGEFRVHEVPYGDCYMAAWQSNAKNIKEALQYMLEKWVDFKSRATLHSATRKWSKPRSQGQLLKWTGCAWHRWWARFYWEHGPRIHHANTQLRWISKQFVSEDRPVKIGPNVWSRRLSGTSWMMECWPFLYMTFPSS